MSALARIYDETHELNNRTILATLPARPGATVLDLGCGDGAFTERVGRRTGAGRLIGLELDAIDAAAARARGIEVVEADLAQPLPFADASIDVVHANQVIEHLADTDLFLREIRRVLRPGGAAVVSTNNLASWHNVVSLALGWQPPVSHVSDEVVVGNPVDFMEGHLGEHIHMHLRLFTERALAELAAYHGLRLDRARTVGYYPLPVRAARLATCLDRRHGAYLVQRYVPGDPAPQRRSARARDRGR
ncbi:MAG: methyltransferase domain-containing protein [Solirubrobacterales bacterium]